MSNVIVKENESLDSALRRFKRNCAKAGIQQEIRKREHYEKPSVRRKKKSEAARNVSSINLIAKYLIPVYFRIHRDFFAYFIYKRKLLCWGKIWESLGVRKMCVRLLCRSLLLCRFLQLLAIRKCI